MNSAVGTWILREVQLSEAPKAMVNILGACGHELFPEGIPSVNVKWVSKNNHDIITTRRISVREYMKQKKRSSLDNTFACSQNNPSKIFKKATLQKNGIAEIHDVSIEVEHEPSVGVQQSKDESNEVEVEVKKIQYSENNDCKVIGRFGDGNKDLD